MVRFGQLVSRILVHAKSISVGTARLAVLIAIFPLVVLFAGIDIGKRVFARARRTTRFLFVDMPRAVSAYVRRLAPLTLALAGMVLLVYLNPARPRPNARPQDVQALSSIAATAATVQPSLEPIVPPERNRELADLDLDAYQGDASARQALADALAIPPLDSRDDLIAAVAIATANARALQPALGHFPLPRGTPKRLLAALSTEDVSLIAHHIITAAAAAAKTSTIDTALQTPGLKASIRVERTDRRCFSYAITVTRQSFRHEIPQTAACLDGGHIILATTK